MKQIVFKSLTPQAKVRRLGTAKMVNGKVKIEFKDPKVQKSLPLERILGSEGTYLSPKDGVDFLLALPAAFSGSRLWAEVEEV
jgi:hypothetical protein